MNVPVFLLSLGAAFMYCVSAGLLHRAMLRGLSGSSANLLCGVSMALIMQGFWVLPVTDRWLEEIWRPVLCGILFFFAQLLTMASLRRAGVGVTTPLLGSKVLFVLLSLSLFGGSELSLRWWAAAVLCFLGICLVSFQKKNSLEIPGRRDHRWGALLGLSSAACFGLNDALYQSWVGFTGPGAFAPVLFLTLAICSIGYSLRTYHWKFGRESTGHTGDTGEKFLALAVGGAVLGAVQAGMLAVAIGYYREAALANLVYGTRALIAVGMAWWIFPHTGRASLNRDNSNFPRVLAGAVFIFASLVVVLYP